MPEEEAVTDEVLTKGPVVSIQGAATEEKPARIDKGRLIFYIYSLAIRVGAREREVVTRDGRYLAPGDPLHVVPFGPPLPIECSVVDTWAPVVVGALDELMVHPPLSDSRGIQITCRHGLADLSCAVRHDIALLYPNRLIEGYAAPNTAACAGTPTRGAGARCFRLWRWRR